MISVDAYMRGRDGERLCHATLSFGRDELIYDIANLAYVEADVLDEGREHGRHVLADVAQEGNVDRVTRLLTLYHAKAVEMLYAWSRHNVHVADEGVAWDDELRERDAYRIDLIVPETTSQSTLNLIEYYVHEYIVCRVLYDWLLITVPEKAQLWAARAAEAQEEIEDAMAGKGGATLRPLFPV